MSSFKVALEGSSFTGKTSFAGALGQHLSFLYVQDYGNWPLPNFPARNVQEARSNAEYFRFIEERYRSPQTGDNELVLTDRSPWSLIGFQKVVSALLPDAPTAPLAFSRTFYEYALHGIVHLPDVLLVKEFPSEEIFTTLVEKRGAIPGGLNFLNYYGTAKLLHDYYLGVAADSYNGNTQQPWAMVIPFSPGNPEESIRPVRDFILECQQRPTEELQLHREYVINALSECLLTEEV